MGTPRVGGRRGARRALRRVLHTGDSPRRTAAALALGVFLGFSPFLGVHTILALGLAFLLRLNRAAALAGTFVLNPWTIVPIYGAGTTLGFLLLGEPPATPPAEIFAGADVLRPATLAVAFRALGPYLAPFVVGNLALGLVAAATAYPLSRVVVERLRVARAARRARVRAIAASARASAPPGTA